MRKKQREIKSCMLKELNGKPIPKGNSFEARKERCILKVKCQQKLDTKAKRVNPYAVCGESVR